MINTLRAAGFTATSTLADVAKRTGLGLDEVKARAGVASSAGVDGTSTLGVLGEGVLDKRFIFPDAFLAQAGTSTKSDAASLVGRSDKSTGLGMGNTGAAGLLRMQLNASVPTRTHATSRPAHRGTEVRDLKEMLLQHVSTLDDAKGLARALGARGEIDGRTVAGFTRHLAQWLQSHMGKDAATKAVHEAVAKGVPPHTDQAAVLGELPLDPSKFANANKWQGALCEALVRGGVDTKEKVAELARRVGLSSLLRDTAPSYALFELVQAMARRSSPQDMANAIAAAVKTPIAHAPDTRSHVTVDASVLPADPLVFPHKGAFGGALRKALVQGGVDNLDVARALATRLGLGEDIGKSEPEHYVFAMIELLLSRHNDDVVKVTQQLKDALATPLELSPPVDGLPARFDASSLEPLKNAGTRGELTKAMLALLKSADALEELAVRLDVANSIPSPEASTPRKYAGAIVDAVARNAPSDIAKAAATIAAALG